MAHSPSDPERLGKRSRALLYHLGGRHCRVRNIASPLVLPSSLLHRFSLSWRLLLLVLAPMGVVERFVDLSGNPQSVQ